MSKETYYSIKRDLLSCLLYNYRRYSSDTKETYYSIKRDLLQYQKKKETYSTVIVVTVPTHVSVTGMLQRQKRPTIEEKETYYMGQKRPSIEAKETYYRGKRDLLTLAYIRYSSNNKSLLTLVESSIFTRR